MKTPFKKLKRVALTTGDVDGIGLEVTIKSLLAIQANYNKTKTLFFLFRDIQQDRKQKQLFNKLDGSYCRFTFFSLNSALSFINSVDNKASVPKNLIVDLALSTSPAEWVYEVALACKNKNINSLVTGPISKKLTQALPGRPIGHTGIFNKIFPKKNLHMAFVGNKFSVLLATDHIPFVQVEKRLLANSFKTSLMAANDFKKLIGSNKKIAVLGLNPHAGESSIMGNSEQRLFKKLNRRVFVGPFSPDAAFLQKNWHLYSLYLCLYHDQGLIPFKSHHGQDSGVHITMGLPFVRTSVDHGTAKDIFNKNRANPNSMLEAIKLNLKLIGVKNV